jgi:uncharacterized protein YqjF (DUF2071 family)
MRNFSQHPRPWDFPERNWAITFDWYDLLFLHWSVPAKSLRPFIPDAVEIDTYDGQAWLGVVPFRMAGVRPRRLPAVPWISNFLELNLRTYVIAEEKPGVWFFSLDAENPVGVRLARAFFHLPYFDAQMSLTNQGDRIEFRSVRTHRGVKAGQFLASYHPTGKVFSPDQGSLEYWLTARYCLYAYSMKKELWRGEIHHLPWPLQPAEAQIIKNSLFQLIGLPEPEASPHMLFSKKISVVAWSLDRVPS